MAHIPYWSEDAIPEADRVPDSDHILRIHGVHPATMRLHYDLYVELMRGPGPLSRTQRESIAVAVSAANHCHY
jgi:alkylhydroperoxidase family enzyme